MVKLGRLYLTDAELSSKKLNLRLALPITKTTEYCERLQKVDLSAAAILALLAKSVNKNNLVEVVGKWQKPNSKLRVGKCRESSWSMMTNKFGNC